MDSGYKKSGSINAVSYYHRIAAPHFSEKVGVYYAARKDERDISEEYSMFNISKISLKSDESQFRQMIAANEIASPARL